MTDIILDKDQLVDNIRAQFRSMDALKYKRSLLEFEDNDGGFLGDNVFETSFKLQDGASPLIYEVSGPYDVISNEYATIGRVYQNGQRIFEADIKDQIQQRTAAMVWLSFDAIGHTPKNILVIGAGKLAAETVRYLKHFMPGLSSLDYHARNARPDTFETTCSELGIAATYQTNLDMSAYDTIIMVTNTNTPLITSDNVESLAENAVIASLCTTSLVGEITGEIYGRKDVNVIFDYDLTRRFTPDMKKAEEAGHLSDVTYLNDIMNGEQSIDLAAKRTILRLTGTPMQNIAVIEMLRDQ